MENRLQSRTIDAKGVYVSSKKNSLVEKSLDMGSRVIGKRVVLGYAIM